MTGSTEKFEGMEEHNDEVTKAAVKYRKARDTRMDMNRKEADRKSELIEQMKKHELTVYEDSDENLLVELTEIEVNVKVKKLETEED